MRQVSAGQYIKKPTTLEKIGSAVKKEIVGKVPLNLED